MKKLIIPLLVISASMNAQVGSQPLYVKNITIAPTPGLCGQPATEPLTATISITAAGGNPATDGSYTYLISPLNITINAVTATFEFSSIDDSFAIQISDSSQNTLFIDEPFKFFGGASTATAVSVDVVSLPLGMGAGCFTLTVMGGNVTGPISFEFNPFEGPNIFFIPVEVGGSEIVSKAPFTVTFSAAPSPFINALITIDNDCSGTTTSKFKFFFPFPQGISNALKAYIFNKYCSCPLSSTATATHI